MGLLWDMFKKGVSLDEAQLCLGELVKLWKVFKECLEDEAEFKGIYLRKFDNSKRREYGRESTDSWELCIAYIRDDYDCKYKAIYDSSKSSYIVEEGYDLKIIEQKKMKGYLFNSIKSIGILNNKITDVIVKCRNIPNSISVVSITSGRTAIVYEGDFESIGATRSMVRRNIDNIEESFYNNILSL